MSEQSRINRRREGYAKTDLPTRRFASDSSPNLVMGNKLGGSCFLVSNSLYNDLFVFTVVVVVYYYRTRLSYCYLCHYPLILLCQFSLRFDLHPYLIYMWLYRLSLFDLYWHLKTRICIFVVVKFFSIYRRFMMIKWHALVYIFKKN